MVAGVFPSWAWACGPRASFRADLHVLDQPWIKSWEPRFINKRQMEQIKTLSHWCLSQLLQMSWWEMGMGYCRASRASRAQPRLKWGTAGCTWSKDDSLSLSLSGQWAAITAIPACNIPLPTGHDGCLPPPGHPAGTSESPEEAQKNCSIC